MSGKMDVVSIDLGEDPGVVKAFAHKNGVPFPIGLGNDKLAERYQIESIPANMVIAPNGKIVYAAEGYMEDEILAAVKKAAPASSPAKHHPAKQAATLPVTRLANAAPGAPGPFRDVPPDHWAAGAVEMLRQKGIVIGYPAQ